MDANKGGVETQNGGSVDKWLQIRITLMMRRIRIRFILKSRILVRIRVKRWIRIRIRFRIIKVMRIRNTPDVSTRKE
jgi:hypothetical protein